jgi:hypothetical protein
MGRWRRTHPCVHGKRGVRQRLPEDEDLHLPLRFNYHFREKAATMAMGGPGLRNFEFATVTPAEVAAIFARATDQLNSH